MQSKPNRAQFDGLTRIEPTRLPGVFLLLEVDEQQAPRDELQVSVPIGESGIIEANISARIAANERKRLLEVALDYASGTLDDEPQRSTRAARR